MQLTGLTLENWLCHRRLDLACSPFTLVCGPNGRGKSAVRDAIAFGLLSELRRITAKGDRDQLITEGADRGTVTLRFGPVEIARDVATGKLTKSGAVTEASPDGLPYVLDPQLFGRLPIDERRVALLRLMGVPIDTHTVLAELTVRGRQTKLLGSAFPHGVPIEKWHEAACRALTEARGAWKGITGEAYGCKKAEGWRATEPEQASPLEYEQALDARQQAEHHIADHQHMLGMIDQAAGGSPASAARRAELERVHGLLPHAARAVRDAGRAVTSLEATLADADARMADVANRLPGRPPDTCPHCGGTVMRQDGVLEPFTPPDDPATPAEHEAAVAARAQEHTALQAARGRHQHAQQQLEAAEAAGVQLGALTAAQEAPGATPTALPTRGTIEAQLNSSRDQLAAAVASIAAYERTVEAIAGAQAITKRAAEAHAKIAAWTLIADDLAPSGIQQSMLGRALTPLNDALRDLSAMFGWPQPRIGEDMGIAVDGRAYGLRSESEQWRADVLLAIAIATLTGLRMVVLDRFDVLELAARSPALGKLYGLTRPGGMLDSCLVLGTMKAPPPAPPDVLVSWLGDALPAPALQVAA